MVVQSTAGHAASSTVVEMVVLETVVRQIVVPVVLTPRSPSPRDVSVGESVRPAGQVRGQVGRRVVDEAPGDDGRFVVAVVPTPEASGSTPGAELPLTRVVAGVQHGC